MRTFFLVGICILCGSRVGVARIEVTDCVNGLELLDFVVRDSILYQVPEMLRAAKTQLQLLDDHIKDPSRFVLDEQESAGLRVTSNTITTLFEPRFGDQKIRFQHIHNKLVNITDVILGNIVAERNDIDAAQLNPAPEGMPPEGMPMASQGPEHPRLQHTQYDHEQKSLLQVSCDPAWIKSVPRSVGSQDKMFVDGWQKNENDPNGQQLAITPEQMDDLQKPSRESMLVFNGLTNPDRAVILLNKHNYNRWTWFPDGLNELQRRPVPSWIKSKTTDMPLASLALAAIADGYLAASLLNALSRVDSFVRSVESDTEPLTPQPCNFPAHYRKQKPMSTRWQCATRLAKSHPEKAIQDPTNFEYLIVALYLSNWDWSLGLNKPSWSATMAEMEAYDREIRFTWMLNMDEIPGDRPTPGLLYTGQRR